MQRKEGGYERNTTDRHYKTVESAPPKPINQHHNYHVTWSLDQPTEGKVQIVVSSNGAHI